MKAATRPALWTTALFRWVVVSVAGGAFAFWAIHTGNSEHKPELYGLGLVTVFAVVGILFKVTADASRPKH
jgi:hypothetical protein